MSPFAGATEDTRRARNENSGASALDTIKTTFESEAEEYNTALQPFRDSLKIFQQSQPDSESWQEIIQTEGAAAKKKVDDAMDAGTGALINPTQPLPEAAQNPAGSLAELCGGFVST